ncbi:hypothetical protein [Streptomyces sp. TS71-3]|uniref:hypothetical protein n=1 Tax=Streptomyces sp. TS71-3 TaxID=2733862 RepID=UPI001B2C5B1E|nr:hypothetical protein [Streptomyces sp. TS71-3]GHJ37590.1 hypothetical protein Sm713_31990 [Streptomyces sp. TS71-3]
MAWDEWEHLKADAAKRRSAGMQIDHVPDPLPGNARDGDLVVHDDELGKLGNMAHDLRDRLSVEGDYARASTFDASVQLFNDGLDTGSALTELHDAWNSQLSTLKEACAHISNHLDFTRGQHGKDDAAIQTGVRDVDGNLLTPSRINEYFE